jgi:hypothetical protein
MTRFTFILLAVTYLLGNKAAEAWSNSDSSRRTFFQTLATGTTFIALPVSALDMDAFANSMLTQPSSQMSSDEALCKFGQPSPEKGGACVRAGKPTTNPSGSGVDAFGNVDRGDFVRCRFYYVIENDKYVKKTECK